MKVYHLQVPIALMIRRSFSTILLICDIMEGMGRKLRVSRRNFRAKGAPSKPLNLESYGFFKRSDRSCKERLEIE